MIKNNLKILIITGIIILLPLIYWISVYSTLPDTIPVHFDFAGNIDGYSDKWLVLLISPIILLIQWAAAIEAHFNSKKEEIKEGYIKGVSYILISISAAINMVMYYCASDNLLTAQKLCPVIVGVIFVVMGNLMPKQKRNKFAGIRFKWTLNDPDNWMRTHRFFGRISMICGFAMISLTFVPNLQVAYAIMFMLMLCVIIIPIAYSYRLSKKTK